MIAKMGHIITRCDTLSQVGRKPFNIGDSEKLRYCDMDIKDAPGLCDARRGAECPTELLILDRC